MLYIINLWIKYVELITRTNFNLIKEIAIATELGIKAILLFPQITEDKKSNDAQESYNMNNLICRAIREIKKQIWKLKMQLNI